ncbi:MAG: caspase family protein [Bacteroidia bacterium]|nr:caspase family protein [Bacteroidia bacterium]
MNRAFKDLLLVCFLLLSGANTYAQQPEISLQTGHTSFINSVRFSIDQNVIATASADNNIILWDYKSGKQVNILSGHKAAVNSIVFGPDSKFLYSVSDDGFLIIWDWKNGTVLKKTKISEQQLKSIAVTEDGKLLFIAGLDIFIYDTANDKVEVISNSGNTMNCNLALNIRDHTIAYSAMRKVFSVIIYDYQQKKELTSFEEKANCIAYSRKGDRIFTGTRKGALNKRDVPGYSLKNDFEIVETFSKAHAPIFCIAADTANFYMADKEKLIYCYNSDGKVRFILRGHTRLPKCMELSKDGKLLLSAGEDQRVYIWNTVSGKLIRTLEGTCDRINSIAYAKNGTALVLAYDKALVKYWDLETNSFINYQMVSAKKNWKYRLLNIDSLSENKAYLTAVYYSTYKQTGFVEEEIFNKVVWDFKRNRASSTDYKKNKYKEKEVRKEMIAENAERCIPLLKACIKVAGDTLQLRSDVNNSLSTEFNTKHKGGINCTAFNPKYNFVSTVGKDGLIKNWSAEGILKGVMVPFAEKDFLFMNEENYYYASKGALKDVGFRMQENIFSFDQFDFKYNRPDLALKKFPYADSLLLNSYKSAYLKRLKKSNITETDFVISKNIPALSVKLPAELFTDKELFEFSVNGADSTCLLENLFINVNGVPIGNKAGEKIASQVFEKKTSVTLSPGKNDIQVYIANEKKIISNKFSFQVVLDAKKTKPDLYLVAMGAGHFTENQYNLAYSEKDAQDVVNLFSRSKCYGNVHTRIYLNEAVRKDSLESIKKFIGGAGINDVVILFVAGHGILDKNLDYYFSTYNVEFTNPEVNGISYDALSGLFDNIKVRKKVLLIDACHSGEIDKEEVQLAPKDTMISGDKLTFRGAGSSVQKKGDMNLKSSFELSKLLFADMRLNNGTTVISSAGGAEYALESKEWKNGAFTYCFLNGLKKGKADLNKDGDILLSELQQYLFVKVSEITQGKQVSTSRAENLQNDFKIW